MRTLALAVLLVASCGGGSQDVAAPAVTALVVEVRDGSARPVDRLSLSCDRPGGSHPDPARACAGLARERQPFAAPPPDAACTQVYGGPQTATVRGTYRGEPVTLHLSRADGCRTAQWDRLGALLPVSA